jgi:hypothetical protein
MIIVYIPMAEKLKVNGFPVPFPLTGPNTSHLYVGKQAVGKQIKSDAVT